MGRIAVVIAWLMLLGQVHAQSDISGRIIDAESGEGLPGASVIIVETGIGTLAGKDGTFLFRDLAPRSYTIAVTFVGYAAATQQIDVTQDGATLEFRLSPAAILLEEVLVEADRPYSAAASRSIRQLDLRIRPSRTAHDMLQLAPGLFIAQHAGGGKAEQIFLRGFDADHGTDIAISVDGIPVNMVSHGHGQGYADLHFLIPEIVGSLDVRKGPYFAEYGNLATAGAVAFKTVDHLPSNTIRVEGGGFETARVTSLLQLPTAGEHQGAYFAGQFYRANGPVKAPQGFNRFNLFGKVHTHIAEQSKLSISAGAFSSGWDASGQIPGRAVASGSIDRFGAIDPLEGGTTSRQDVSLRYETGLGTTRSFVLQPYVTRYNFKLFSNFTFYLDDPVNGDMIEQTDSRNILGLNSEYRFTNISPVGITETAFGGGFRTDDASVSLWHSPNRIRRTPRARADIRESNLFLWGQESIQFNPHVRLQVGVRADYLTFDVVDHLDAVPDTAGTGLPHASGYGQGVTVNPKLNLVLSPTDRTDLYLNAGTGYHSNDARDVVLAERMEEIAETARLNGATEGEIEQTLSDRNFDPDHLGIRTLPRAYGGEVGFRTRISDHLHLGVATWILQSQEELVFVGDAGETEINDESRRYGIDLEARLRILPWLWADADLNLSRGRVVDASSGADEIALAPRRTSTGGLTFSHPTGWDGTLRYRYIGDRPANEDNSVVAEGYLVVDMGIGYRIGRTRLTLRAENLLDTEWNEAQFDTESRLAGELTSVSEIHFTPGNPRNLQAGISYDF